MRSYRFVIGFLSFTRENGEHLQERSGPRSAKLPIRKLKPRQAGNPAGNRGFSRLLSPSSEDQLLNAVIERHHTEVPLYGSEET